MGEYRATGERKYYLTNHPPATPLRVLAAAIKARWVCEQAHQQLKQELGLDHFEGRSWSGLHHHALLAMIAFAYLQHLRLGHAEDDFAAPGTPAGPPPQPTLPAVRRLLVRVLSNVRRCPRCDGPLRPLALAGRKVAK